MVKTLYDQWWHLKVFYVDSSDSGHSGSTRFRMYIIGWWKDDVIEVFNMDILYDMIVAATKKQVGTRPSDYMVSQESELCLEAQQLAITRKKTYKNVVKLS